MKLMEELKVTWENTRRSAIVYFIAGFVLAGILIGSLT